MTTSSIDLHIDLEQQILNGINNNDYHALYRLSQIVKDEEFSAELRAYALKAKRRSDAEYEN